MTILSRLDQLEKDARPADKPLFFHTGMAPDMSDANYDLVIALCKHARSLIDIAMAAKSLLAEDGAFEAVSHFNVAFALKDALSRLEEPKV